VAEPSEANARCPRCGGGFHCGAQEASCDCAGVSLDDAMRETVRLNFEGCLCIACLRELQKWNGLDALPHPGRSAL